MSLVCSKKLDFKKMSLWPKEQREEIEETGKVPWSNSVGVEILF